MSKNYDKIHIYGDNLIKYKIKGIEKDQGKSMSELFIQECQDLKESYPDSFEPSDHKVTLTIPLELQKVIKSKGHKFKSILYFLIKKLDNYF